MEKLTSKISIQATGAIMLVFIALNLWSYWHTHKYEFMEERFSWGFPFTFYEYSMGGLFGIDHFSWPIFLLDYLIMMSTSLTVGFLWKKKHPKFR